MNVQLDINKIDYIPSPNNEKKKIETIIDISTVENIVIERKLDYFKILGIWFSFFFDYILNSSFILIIPAQFTNHSYTTILFSLKPLFQFISLIFFYKIIERFILEPIIFGLILELISIALFYFKNDFIYWCIGRSFHGLGSCLILSSGYYYIQSIYNYNIKHLNIAMGIVSSGIIFGIVVGPPITGFLYSFKKDFFYLFLSIINILIQIYIVFKIFQKKKLTTSKNVIINHEYKLIEIIKNSNVFSTLFVLFICSISISSLESKISEYLISVYNYTTKEIGVLILVSAIPSALSSKISGYIINIFGNYNILFLGNILIALSFLLYPKYNLYLFITSLFIFGIGTGLVQGTVPSILASISIDEFNNTGKIYILQNITIQLGFFIGPLISLLIINFYDFQIMSFFIGFFVFLFSSIIIFKKNI